MSEKLQTKTGKVIQAEISDLIFSTKRWKQESVEQLHKLMDTNYVDVDALKQWAKNALVSAKSPFQEIRELLACLKEGKKQ